MLEVYVLITLSAIGFMLNQATNTNKKSYGEPKQNEVPSMDNVYNSRNFERSDKIVRGKANKMYEASRNPAVSGVISKNHHFDKEKPVNDREEHIRSLTGKYMQSQEFVHNNMTPYFGSRMRQNMDDKSNKAILENFTGVGDLQKNKCEQRSFYDLSKENIHGSQNSTDFYKDRLESKIRNNEFPIPKVTVGPGLGQGYNANPTGGFQQFGINEYAQEKCVDELRPKNKPKITYDARNVDGMKTPLRGEIGSVEKNRVERFYEQTPDMYLTTVGSTVGNTQRPKVLIEDTNRQTTSSDYVGTAGATNKKRRMEPDAKQSYRQQFGSYGVRNATLSATDKAQSKHDYGKSQILVYNNERDLTTTKVYQGNVVSLIKNLVAPITDMVKITKKQEHVDSARHFGNMSIQIPDKPTIYDPTDVARTTIKETLIHDEIGTGTLTGAKQLYVYDSDEVAKKTLRETMERLDYEMNISSHVNKGTVYDPDDKLRTTINETTIDNYRDGNIDSRAKGGAYETNEMDARTTQKEFISDNDFYGQATRDLGIGYETNEHEARTTQKEFISDKDYFGVAGDMNKEFMSYEDYQNARISANKEVTLEGREPTQTGTKVFNDQVSMMFKKQVYDKGTFRTTGNTDKVYNNIPTMSDHAITKSRLAMDLNIGDRLDSGIIDSLKNNPYNRSIAETL